MSLNRAALALMRRGAGLKAPGMQADVEGTSLDHLMGIWNEEEAAEFRQATRDFDRIDEDLGHEAPARYQRLLGDGPGT